MNQTSESLTETDTSLTDQMYEVVLDGLTEGVLYYVRVATTADGVTFYSESTSFRTIQSGTVTL